MFFHSKIRFLNCRVKNEQDDSTLHLGNSIDGFKNRLKYFRFYFTVYYLIVNSLYKQKQTIS